MCKAVIYIRVSTRKQEITGLGIEAQRRIATDFCQSRQWEVAREFVEVQSGGRNDREMAREALEQCELTGAVLVVAKLDRISRDVGFIDQLQKSGVRFVCADMPEANETMIQFMAVFAAYERKMASERTKAALQGKEGLGNPNILLQNEKAPRLTDEAIAKGRAMRSEKANKRNQMVLQEIRKIQEKGIKTLQGIADELNKIGVLTPKAAKLNEQGQLTEEQRKKLTFSATQVKRILETQVTNMFDNLAANSECNT